VLVIADVEEPLEDSDDCEDPEVKDKLDETTVTDDRG